MTAEALAETGSREQGREANRKRRLKPIRDWEQLRVSPDVMRAPLDLIPADRGANLGQIERYLEWSEAVFADHKWCVAELAVALLAAQLK
jgi:hypothetical protein